MTKKAKAQSAQNEQPAATPETSAAPAVALRGGPAVASVKLTDKVYRCKVKHNADWWQAIASQAGAGPVAVATLIAAPHNIPAAFVGYCLRRGYLAEVK